MEVICVVFFKYYTIKTCNKRLTFAKKIMQNNKKYYNI